MNARTNPIHSPGQSKASYPPEVTRHWWFRHTPARHYRGGSLACVLCTLTLAPPSVSSTSAADPPAAPSIEVTVDPRVELVSIIFRLAGHQEYNQGRVDSYTDDVEQN